MRLPEEELRWLRGFEGAEYALDNSGRYAETLDLLRRFITPSSQVVDLGMFPGHLALLLRRRHGVAVTGLSFAHTVSFAARMRAEGIAVHEADITREDPRLPPASFDIALCTEIIEHMDRPLPLLVRANRLLKPGGLLVLSTPNHASLKCRLNLLAGRATNDHLFGTQHVYQMNEWVHRREYTAAELRRLLEPVGYEVVQTHFMKMQHARPGARAKILNLLKNLLGVIPSLQGGVIVVARKSATATYTSLIPDTLGGLIRPASLALTAQPGAALDLPVEVENTGTSTWLIDRARGYGYVQLGAHLRDASDQLLDFDFLRCPLPHDLPPGARALLSVRLAAPAAPGNYVLELDLVNEAVTWFHNYGSPTADIRLRVAP